jgi:hypothetical protein
MRSSRPGWGAVSGSTSWSSTLGGSLAPGAAVGPALGSRSRARPASSRSPSIPARSSAARTAFTRAVARASRSAVGSGSLAASALTRASGVRGGDRPGKRSANRRAAEISRGTRLRRPARSMASVARRRLSSSRSEGAITGARAIRTPGVWCRKSATRASCAWPSGLRWSTRQVQPRLQAIEAGEGGIALPVGQAEAAHDDPSQEEIQVDVVDPDRSARDRLDAHDRQTARHLREHQQRRTGRCRQHQCEGDDPASPGSPADMVGMRVRIHGRIPRPARIACGGERARFERTQEQMPQGVCQFALCFGAWEAARPRTRHSADPYRHCRSEGPVAQGSTTTRTSRALAEPMAPAVRNFLHRRPGSLFPGDCNEGTAGRVRGGRPGCTLGT